MLQRAAYIVLTTFLIQRSSAESRDPGRRPARLISTPKP